MRRALLLVFVSAVLAVASLPTAGVAAKPKKQPWSAKPKAKPAPKPAPAPTPTAPTTIIDETAVPEVKPAEKTAAARTRVELAVCEVEDLEELENAALLKLVRRCRTLSTVPRKDGAVSSSGLESEQMLVAICVRKAGDGDEVLETAECDLKASIQVDGGKTLSLGADGDLALALRTSKLARDANPSNGESLDLSATFLPEAREGVAPETVHTRLIWRRSLEGYGRGRAFWLPLPMFTTDFSTAADGYRLGITPIAVALGWKWFPSPGSQGYLGVSAFVGWNLLVPNNTQTLTNGTSVRVNYKAAGGGLLFDASGWFAVGVGIGRTFTTDSRTDLRTWLYFGPKLLGGLNEF